VVNPFFAVNGNMCEPANFVAGNVRLAMPSGAPAIMSMPDLDRFGVQPWVIVPMQVQIDANSHKLGTQNHTISPFF
jgi:hypothetical protein